MVSVNPPPHIPLPAAFRNDSELRSYFLAVERILFQLWTRSGGGADGISSLDDRVTITEAEVDALFVSRKAEINTIERLLKETREEIKTMRKRTDLSRQLESLETRLIAVEKKTNLDDIRRSIDELKILQLAS